MVDRPTSRVKRRRRFEQNAHLPRREREAPRRAGRRWSPSPRSAAPGPTACRSVVVLPAPLGPRNAVTPPGPTVAVKPVTVETAPKRFVRPSKVSVAVTACQPSVAASRTRGSASTFAGGVSTLRLARRDRAPLARPAPGDSHARTTHAGTTAGGRVSPSTGRFASGMLRSAGLPVEQHRDVAMTAPQAGLIDHQHPAALRSPLRGHRVRPGPHHPMMRYQPRR